MSFTSMWPCIVKNFFIIKSARCTNFPNLLRHETTCFGQFLCPSSRVYSLYARHWYMPYRFVDSFRAVPSWSCSKAVFKPIWLIPVPSVRWINSWWWPEELPETWVSWRSKLGKLVHLVGFIIKKNSMYCMYNNLTHFTAFLTIVTYW